MECCSPGNIWWILLRHGRMGARLVCVADSYHSLNSVFCAEHFYYVSCLYAIFPCVLCLNCLCMQSCSMLGDIDEPLKMHRKRK